MPVGSMETVIRDNQSKEELGDAKLNQQELGAITTLKNALDGNINAKDKIGKANQMNAIINKHFSFYDKTIDTKTNTFKETKQEESKKGTEIKNRIDVFYSSLLTDLRAKYESMSYEKDGEKNTNNVLELASFFINMYAGDDANTYVRADKNIQQTEEKFKGMMRKVDPEKKSVIQTIQSKAPNVPVGYRLKETKTETIDGPKKSLDNRYDLDPAMIGDKATIEKSFEGIKNLLNKEGIKITSFNIVGLSSKTDYVYGKQEVKLGNETLIVTDNQTLADARAKIAEDRFTTNFGSKFISGYASSITNQPEIGPEYVRGTDDAKDPKYREFQGIRFKVEYTETKKENTYVFEKEQKIDPPKGYNLWPATTILIHDANDTYSQIDYSGGSLNKPNGIVAAPQNALIRGNKNKQMFERIYQEGKDGKQESVVRRRYDQYVKYSEENPSKYPKISDPQKDLSRIDKVNRTNESEYGKGETTSKTPILNLDVHNPVHKGIIEEMKSQGVITEKNGQYSMTLTKTDKYISEYMAKRTKIYVKDGIASGQRNDAPA